MAVRGAGLTWSAMEGVVEAQRAVKDAAEIAVLRRAGRELAYIASRLGDWLAEGRTEREVARAIDSAIERAALGTGVSDDRRVRPQ